MRLLELSVALAVVGCLDPSKAGNLVPRTVAEDRSLPRIDLPDTAFHGELLGDPTGPLLVLLHGGPGADHRYMLPVAEQLADDGYGVVVWDHRGAGLSTRHDPGDFHWEQPVEDLRLVIEHFSVDADQPVVFVGHSWGAMYATWFINEHGDYGGRVRGAVLSEPGAYTSEQLESYFGRLFGSMDFLGEQVNDTAWKDQLMTPGDHARADYLWAITAVALPSSLPLTYSRIGPPLAKPTTAATWYQTPAFTAVVPKSGGSGKRTSPKCVPLVVCDTISEKMPHDAPRIS